MNIQIFGIKKCFDTKKAQRFFKERNIKYQFIDIKEKDISKKEFLSISSSIPLESIINVKSKNFSKSNLEHIRSTEMKHSILLNDQTLINTPIVRNEKEATIGYSPSVWEEWLKNQ